MSRRCRPNTFPFPCRRENLRLTTEVKAAATLALAMLVAVCAQGQAPIRLKTRELVPPARDQRIGLAPGKRRAHYIVQFGQYPGPPILRELARRGIRVLDYVPEFALMVSSAPDADLTGLDVRFAGPLPPADKISPELETRNSPAYLVIFHSDVDMDTSRALATQHGFVIHDNPGLLPGHLVVGGGWRELYELAAADEVAYVLPARADLAFGTGVKGCAGALTEAGAVGQYATVGTGWPADVSGRVALKYAIRSIAPSLDYSLTRQELTRALQEWARYGNLTFSQTYDSTGDRTIAFYFATRAHGDNRPFDGPGGLVGHGFYPAPPNREPIAGDVHLDADEDWHIGAQTDLFSVALHELGHALGLGHSDNPESVMYPYYQISPGLAADDIATIRQLYGTAPGVAQMPSGGGSTPTPPTTPANPSDNLSPSLRITYPATTLVSTSSSTIAVAGTATDNVRVASVRWSTSSGYSGTADGTASWKASVPLLLGTNTVKVTATDLAGNSSWRSLTIVRR